MMAVVNGTSGDDTIIPNYKNGPWYYADVVNLYAGDDYVDTSLGDDYIDAVIVLLHGKSQQAEYQHRQDADGHGSCL